jgi:hypothetical protein
LFAIAGLAIDGSAKYADRRHAQNAADAAALAGALAKSENPPDPLWNIVALDRALDNGYDDNHVTNEVSVYNCKDKPDALPGDCGHYNGDSNYVLVVIVSYVDTYFARVIGISQTVNAVQAVALAKKGGPLGDGAMIMSYDPDPSCSGGTGGGGGSVDVSGSGTLNLNGGGIFLNSGKTCGYNAPNCPDINITGGGAINSVAGIDNILQKELGPSCAYPPVPENHNADPVIIPDGIEMPSEPIECSQLATSRPDPIVADTYHITPGYYSDFPQANINGNIVGIKKHIIMDPGVYCVGKSIHWSGNTFYSLNGSSGVTIYLKEGFDFDLTINSPITLKAPHTGSNYDGYIIIQDGTPASIGSCTINGGAYLDMEGTIFAPYCDITVNGGGEPTAKINAQLVGWDIKLTGNNTINFNYDPSKTAKITRRVGLIK